jgi:opacity protein-like surface antigen
MHLSSRQRRIVTAMLAALFVVTASSLFSQVVPATRGGGLPLTVGAGFSLFDLDYGQDAGTERRMEGVTAWANYAVPYTPRALRGLALEVEGRDINFNRPAALVRMRQDTLLGGVSYTWRQYRNFHPYAKGLLGIGSIDFPPSGTYSHDTRTVFAPGGGLEYRAFRSLWVRADYEYQFWPKLFGPHTLDPNGFTIGVAYDFRRGYQR